MGVTALNAEIQTYTAYLRSSGHPVRSLSCSVPRRRRRGPGYTADGVSVAVSEPPCRRVSRNSACPSVLSAEFLGVGLRQYADGDQARASFDALATALESCTGETYDGVESTYAAMSAPDVGDASLGVKILADGVGLLQFFAVVGPVLVNTGGGGLMNANADEVMRLLETQVKKYEGAAGS